MTDDDNDDDESDDNANSFGLKMREWVGLKLQCYQYQK